ncbi:MULTISPECIES: hypothetical protein [unclassified Janthinobacterium]|uniref:hypothetical protein n=1 Tax=unclassified Janthinobacterium TaxID=2610881 RepID=UPI0025B2EED8|nr:MULTISPECIES: hypothetical protein [unclassified Janthinobacterium]MDN2702864.1 hypothetical protein [Janthinobacterium sp. SUN100]MDN2714814.1 hypothetical protein [Janthinobacterium sp. SUN120]MDO8066956.1 hypothetical protein [Janthinobacterium sp. SUN206]
MKTDLLRLIAHPCLLAAALLGAAGANAVAATQGANNIAEKMAGFTCTGNLQMPMDPGEHTIALSFDAPDQHGAQGTLMVDERGKASNFYDCRQSGDNLACTYDAGPASGPLTMRFSGKLKEVKGEINSPFENSATMHFSARCQKSAQ